VVDLNAMKLFVVASEAGSLSEAARRTGVPLPTLSRHVRNLEDELGIRLLDRGPKGLGLTAAGAQLVLDVAPALASLAQAEQRLQDASGIAGTLRVSMPPHLEPLWDLFADFHRRFPAVRFDIFVTDRRVDLVADGVDVAIRVGDRGAGSYVGRTLTRYRHRVVAAPQLLAEHPVTAPEHLLLLPCACWRTSGPSAWTLGGAELRLQPMLVTNDYTHLLRLALAGEAVTEVPPFLARRALDEGRLCAVLPDHPLPEQPLRALVVERRAMSPLVRQFLDYAVETVDQALC
jgi:DNA-binding transcriptional LysR family regulator